MPRLIRPLLAALLLPVSAAASAQACDGLVLARALLTSEIDNREPGKEVRAVSDQPALFAFTEVLEGNGRTLVHRWRHDGEVAAEITLSIRGDRWRTWSSKNLGLRRDNGWQVDILDDSGCLLTRLTLNAAPDPLLAPVRALLEAGELGDAKLALARLEQQHPDKAGALAAEIRPWLVLASAEQEIEEDQLYLAQSRLDALVSDDGALVQQRDAALARLAERKRLLDHELALKLEAMETMARDKPLHCELTARNLDDWLTTAPLSSVTVMDRVNGRQRLEMEVLDTRTGTSHTLSVPCAETATAD